MCTNTAVSGDPPIVCACRVASTPTSSGSRPAARARSCPRSGLVRSRLTAADCRASTGLRTQSGRTRLRCPCGSGCPGRPRRCPSDASGHSHRATASSVPPHAGPAQTTATTAAPAPSAPDPSSPAPPRPNRGSHVRAPPAPGQRYVQAAARIKEPKADTGFPTGPMTGVIVIEANPSLHLHIQ